MVKQSSTKRPIDKKQAVLDAALALFVEHGFHSTSTASIAKHAKVATGTLFHHFPSKEAILSALFVSIKTDFATDLAQQYQLTGQLKQDAQQLWQLAIDWAIKHPLKQQFFLQYSLSSSIPSSVRQYAMTEILTLITDLIEQGQQQGLIVNYPVSLMLENCHGQYLAAIRFFTDNPEFGYQSEYRDASFLLFWRAIAIE
ncbi:TetR/AcrR family transcriptional regulator [Shewanella maritima]|uniref:TetR/AcrR family transcriptional regulator n=1 Tax=Shewanella maritima TaxID=2520507 RepID=UPI0037350F56